MTPAESALLVALARAVLAKDGWPANAGYLAAKLHEAVLEVEEESRKKAEGTVADLCTCGHINLHHSSWGNCMVQDCACKEFYPREAK